METAGQAIESPELRSALKGKGLGIPATRAGIIEEIKKAGYIQVSGRKLLPSDLAYAMTSVQNADSPSSSTRDRFPATAAKMAAGSLPGKP